MRRRVVPGVVALATLACSASAGESSAAGSWRGANLRQVDGAGRHSEEDADIIPSRRLDDEEEAAEEDVQNGDSAEAEVSSDAIPSTTPSLAGLESDNSSASGVSQNGSVIAERVAELPASMADMVLASSCASFMNLTNFTAPQPMTASAQDVTAWLREAPYQATIAAGALVLGCFCAWDGPGLWHILFTVLAAACAGGIVHHEVKSREILRGALPEAIAALFAAALTALSTHLGFEGSQVLLGSASGFLAALSLSAWIQIAGLPTLTLLWCIIGALVGLCVSTIFRRPVLATAAPTLGGFLVASGGGLLLRRIINLLGKMDADHEAPVQTFLPPLDANWYSTAAALLGDKPSLLAVQAGISVLSAFIFGLQDSRGLAVAILAAGIAVPPLVVSSGFGCKLIGICPTWIAETTTPLTAWMVIGTAAWVVVAAASAWRQLGKLQAAEVMQAWEARNMALLGLVHPNHGYMQVEQPTNFVTTPPAGYAPASQRSRSGLFQTQTEGTYMTRPYRTVLSSK